MKCHATDWRARLLLSAALLLTVGGRVFGLEESWPSDQNAKGFRLYNLPAPTLGTAALRLQDATPGNCILQSTAINGSIVCSTLTGFSSTAPLVLTGSVLSLSIDSSLAVNAGVLQRPALTGAITAAAGSNATAFGALAAYSVLSNATGSSAVPSALAAGSDGLVLGRFASSLTFHQLVEGDISNLTADLAAKVPTTRTVSTTAPLAGGGALSGDLTLTLNPATTSTAGSLSAADKTKLDSLTSGAAVASVSGTAPVTSTGGTTPAVGLTTDATLAVVSSALGRAATTGDVVIPAGSNTTTIQPNVVTNAKAAQMGASTIKGNATNATANAQDVAATGANQAPISTGSGWAWSAITPGVMTGAFSAANGPGPTAVGTPGVATTFARSDQTPAAYRSDIPLSATWFVDPVSGSDASTNNCTTAATACLTLQEIKRRWWGAEITQNTTVTILGNLGSTDVGEWSISLAPGVTVTFLGSLGSTTGFGGRAINNTLFSGTVTTFSAASTSPAADDIEMTDSSIPTSFTASGLMASGVIFRRTVTATRHWYALKDIGSKTIRMTSPIGQNGGPGTTFSALTVGDAYSAFQMWTMPPQAFHVNDPNRIIFDSLYESTAATFAGTNSVKLARVWLGSAISITAIGFVDINCMFEGSKSIQPIAGRTINLAGGGFKGNGSDSFSCQAVSLCVVSGAMVSQGVQVTTNDGGAWSVESQMAVHDTTIPMLRAYGSGKIYVNAGASTGVSGKGNTSKIVITSINSWFGVSLNSVNPPFVAGSTTDAAPIQIGSDTFTVAQMPNSGEWHGPSDSTFPSYVYETGATTKLGFGTVADGGLLKRVGTSIVGVLATTFLSDPGGNGLVARTSAGTTTNRTIVNGDTSIGVTNGDGFSGNPSIIVAAHGVTAAKFRQSAASSLVGNPTGSTADVSDITLGAGCSFSGTTLTCPGTGVPTTRTLTTTAPMTCDGAGSCDLSANRTLNFPDFVASGASHARGAVPDPGSVAGTTKFLREDKTWAVPPGTSSGTVSSVTASLPLTSSGGATPNIALNYDTTTVTLNGSNQIQVAALTGDVTKAAGSNATAIAANAVTNAKAAQMGALTIKGNNTGLTANALDLTATQATAMLDAFTSVAKGLVPASGGGTSNFMRADGTWAVPPSGGGGTITDVSATAPLTSTHGATPTIALSANGITDALLRQGVASSVIGRSAASTGNVADIQCTADGNVLWRSGTTLGCSLLDYSKITNTPVWPTTADVLVSSGTTTTPTGDTEFRYGLAAHSLNGGRVLLMNGASDPGNAFLVGNDVTASGRDRAQFFVGGGGTTDFSNQSSLFWVSMGNSTIPAGTTSGIWSAMRVDPARWTGVSSPTITEADGLYIGGAPTLTSATGATYALHVAGGTTRLDGALRITSLAGPGFVRTDASGNTSVANVGGSQLAFFGNLNGAITGAQWLPTSNSVPSSTFGGNPVEYRLPFVAATVDLLLNNISSSAAPSCTQTLQVTRNGSAIFGSDISLTGNAASGVYTTLGSATGSASSSDTYGLEWTNTAGCGTAGQQFTATINLNP